MLYRQQIEQALGQQLPPVGQESATRDCGSDSGYGGTSYATSYRSSSKRWHKLKAAQQTPQIKCFQQQLALEKGTIDAKEVDDIRAAEIELQKTNSAQIRREQIEADLRKQDSKDAIQLQELELKAKADAFDKNYNELVKTVRESRNQNGDNNCIEIETSCRSKKASKHAPSVHAMEDTTKT